jgi:hypothetical protein
MFDAQDVDQTTDQILDSLRYWFWDSLACSPDLRDTCCGPHMLIRIGIAHSQPKAQTCETQAVD